MISFEAWTGQSIVDRRGLVMLSAANPCVLGLSTRPGSRLTVPRPTQLLLQRLFKEAYLDARVNLIRCVAYSGKSWTIKSPFSPIDTQPAPFHPFIPFRSQNWFFVIPQRSHSEQTPTKALRGSKYKTFTGTRVGAAHRSTRRFGAESDLQLPIRPVNSVPRLLVI